MSLLLFQSLSERAKPHHHISNKSLLQENPDLTGECTLTHTMTTYSSFVIIKPQTSQPVHFVMKSQISLVASILKDLGVVINVIGSSSVSKVCPFWHFAL